MFKHHLNKEGEGDGWGICSPPLWKTNNPHQNLTNYSQLSADAKAQAVARGQDELMEMIKNMPESSYELSLKDIVEHNHLQQTETHDNINPYPHFTKEVFTKRKTDGAFLLKIVFPFDFRSKRKKPVSVSELSKLASSKVSPRSSSVRSSDGRPWFGENDSLGRTSTSKSNIKRIGSLRSSSKDTRELPSGIFLTRCWSAFSFKKRFYDDE